MFEAHHNETIVPITGSFIITNEIAHVSDYDWRSPMIVDETMESNGRATAGLKLQMKSNSDVITRVKAQKEVS